MNEQNETSSAFPPEPALLTGSPAKTSAAVTRLIYRGKGTVIIAGRCFRQVYVFSPKEPEQLVDAEDVGALVRTGFFLVRR
jgi:hypothetical protein